MALTSVVLRPHDDCSDGCPEQPASHPLRIHGGRHRARGTRRKDTRRRQAFNPQRSATTSAKAEQSGIEQRVARQYRTNEAPVSSPASPRIASSMGTHDSVVPSVMLPAAFLKCLCAVLSTRLRISFRAARTNARRSDGARRE